MPRTQKQFLSMVSLVGAGPGDPELISVKGLKALQSAAVVLYDALVNPILLEEVPKNCIKVFVGKRAGIHRFPQERINQLLVQYALEKGHVVRLKGGDPFVFGRGYEEKKYIEAYGIPVTVIPGISCCTALPALQHIPVTLRGVNESFWVLTGTTRKNALPKDLCLAAQSTATVVILMGIRKVEQIMAIFRQEGKADMGAMAIFNGSQPSEKVILGTVATLASQIKRAQTNGPGTLVIGEVVKLHEELCKAQEPILRLKQVIDDPSVFGLSCNPELIVA
ncbi:MAG: uroporphyrinogen-III C-methyltransferase [Bacteroidota bacterium]